MTGFRGRRRKLTAAAVASLVGFALVAIAPVPMYGQEQSEIYVLAINQNGEPILELDAADITVKEDVGQSQVVSVKRFGWPMRVTVLLDNGPGTESALVHYRSGLKKFFEGLPPTVPVTLITTAPNPRFLIRDSKDRVQIERAVNLITPDDGLGRFSDALIEYSRRLDEEFRLVTEEQLPPYMPVLVSIATTHQDGSDVRRESNERMLRSLMKHRVSSNLIMVTPSRTANEPESLTNIQLDEGQNAEIAKIVQEATRGSYTPITGSGTSSLSTTILPGLAQAITLRYIRQMSQHQVVIERPAGAAGPMKNFALTLSNHPGAKVIISTDGIMP
jgi:hypothetical protein